MSTGWWIECVNEYRSVSVSGCVVCQQAGRISVLTSTAVCHFQGVLCVNRRVDCVLTSTALC